MEVDGQPVAGWKEMSSAIYTKVEKEISVTYERAGEKASVTLKTRKASDAGGPRGVIGIAPGVEYARVPLLKGLAMGAHQCWYWTAFTVKTLASNIHKREKPECPIPVVGALFVLVRVYLPRNAGVFCHVISITHRKTLTG